VYAEEKIDGKIQYAWLSDLFKVLITIGIGIGIYYIFNIFKSPNIDNNLLPSSDTSSSSSSSSSLSESDININFQHFIQSNDINHPYYDIIINIGDPLLRSLMYIDPAQLYPEILSIYKSEFAQEPYVTHFANILYIPEMLSSYINVTDQYHAYYVHKHLSSDLLTKIILITTHNGAEGVTADGYAQIYKVTYQRLYNSF